MAAAAAAPAAAPVASAFSDDAWSSMINRVSPSVCVVRMFVRHAFEGGPQAYVSEGTGFVVDSERGLILTNRHIVTIGVTSLTAQIGDEEVDVTPIYRDPVHDFGLLRFNPANLKFGVPAAIPLRPDACRVGAEIRIIGNDAGERRQVLSAAIARLDRNSPNYGRLGWNDVNTFYIGAASNTSGGSSGSPVLNIRGEAVGINAGGATSAASAMYLPLWPAVRALERLRRGEYVPRGDCHTIFTHKRFHEVLRSGVPAKVVTEVKESGMRAHVEAGGSEGDADAGATGMLEVSHVLRGGVSARGSRAYDKAGVRRGFLQPGDVIFKVNGQVVSAFWPVEQALDAAMEALCDKEAVISAKRSSGSAGAGTGAAAAGGSAKDEDEEGDVLQAPWTSVRLLGEGGGEEGAEVDGKQGDESGEPVAADDDAFLRALNAAGDTSAARPTSLPAPKSAYAPATGPRPTADDPDCPAAHPAAASNGREALGKVRFTVVRAGRVLDVDIPVVDAHALVPRRVLQIGGAGIAELSVIRSINNGHPQGVCVINPPGFVFADVGKDVVLRGVDGHEVTCLADAAAALAVVREDSYFSVTVSDLHSPAGARRSVVCYMTRRFHPARILSRHVADDCAAEGDSPSRWLETAMPSLQLAIAGADGEAEGAVPATDDDAASLPGTGPVLPAAAQALVMEAVTEALGDYNLSPEALGGGGLADGVPDDASEGGEADEDAAGSSPDEGDEDAGDDAEGQGDSDADDEEEEEEEEEAEEEGESIDFQFDPGALLATAATKGGPAARAELEAALRKALDQAGVQSPDGDDGIGAMVDAIMSQAQAAMVGASKVRGRATQRATAEDSKAMAAAIREQRLASLEKAPKPVQDAAMALVGIECRLPLQIDGVETGGLEAMMGMGSAAAGNVSHGRGVVVDSDLGIVLVDRAIVPVFMAIVHVVMGVARVPARVLFVSPSSTFALIQADLSGRSESGGLRLADAIKAVRFGDDSVGLRDMTLERKAAKKAGAKDAVWFLALDETGGVSAAQDDVFQAAQNVATALPEYAGQAFEAYRIVNTVGYGVMSEPGIAVNAKGEIVAMISEVGGDSPLGVSAEWLKEPVSRVIRRIKEGTSATLSDLGVQLEFVALADAQAALGMPARRAAALMNNTVESEVIVVAQVVAGSAAGERFGLRERDVLLEVLPDSWPEPDDDPTSIVMDDMSDAASEDGEAATKRAVTAADSAEPSLARSVLAALGVASASPPRPSYKDDLTEPLPIRSAADVILRCRLRSSVRLRVLRDGREVCVTARTDPVEVRGASKVVVQWQGMTMTPPDVGLLRRSGVPWVGVPPHRSAAAASAWNNGASTPHKAPAAERAAIAMQGSGLQSVPSARGKAQSDGVDRVDFEARLPAGVVCCFTESGSEASAQLGQAYWVLKINETPVPTLDDVLYVTSRLPERLPVTVTLGEILNGQTKIITLRPDSAALPLLRFVHGERFQWRREVVTGPWSPGSAALQRQSSLSVGPGTFGAAGPGAAGARKDDAAAKAAPVLSGSGLAWAAGGLVAVAGAAGLVAMVMARSRAASSTA